MIGKKIAPHPNDQYRKLALYIAAAKDKGEKLHSLWMENLDAGSNIDDLDLGILEVEATQKQNNRAKSSKSYHLIISFRAEDELPNAEALKDIEKTYAEALGFEDHQRIAAVHQNTNNYHIHVAINRVHPMTLKLHSPSHDFRSLEHASIAIEKKYGLSPDYDHSLENELKPQKEKTNKTAKEYEARTWEQSFVSYVKEHKEELRAIRDQSQNWQEFHDQASAFSITFRKRGNGLIIESDDKKQRMKASDLGRDFSKTALEEKLGPFQAPTKQRNHKTTKKHKAAYKPKPITKHPKTNKLWNRYIGLRNNKKTLAHRAFENFRDFLQYEALDDPMAMAIIIYQKKLINTLLNHHPERLAKIAHVPKYWPPEEQVSEQQKAERISKWMRHMKTQKQEKTLSP